MANKQVKLIDLEKLTTKDVPFLASLIVDKINKQAMFDAVVAEQAAQRQGTHSTLTKGEVRGGGKKPWMQKHTGNARQGSTRNPQWVGGGVAFGPKPNRNYKSKVNDKVIHLAFKSAISEKLEKNNIYLFESADIKKPQTKLIANLLKKIDLVNKKTLFVLDKNQNNILKSIRNVNKATVKTFNQVSTRDVMNANTVFIYHSALEQLGKVYK